MKSAKIILAFFSVALLILWLLPESMLAQEVNQAALVIRTSEQDVQTACVEFSEAEITGLDVLQRSGIDFEIDVQSMGAKICSIEQTGCPADDCWCQCKGGGNCIYWSYWHQLNGQWAYSQGGASMYSIGDGDVEGWSWGPGSANEAFPPPDVSFSDVCTTEQVEEPTETPSPTAEPILFVPEDTPISVPTQSQAAATATATPLPSATYAAMSTAVPTVTPLPANTATAVPAATAQQQTSQVVSEPTAVPTMTVESAMVVADQSLDPPARSDPLPTPPPLPPTPEALQPAPQAVAAAVVVEADVSTRPPQRDIKNRVDIDYEANRELNVVGAAFEMADLGPARIDVEAYQAELDDQNNSTSMLSYAIFCLIVSGLAGLLLLSSLRRQVRQD